MRVRSIAPPDQEAVLSLSRRLLIGVAPWRDPDVVAVAARSWVTAALDRAPHDGAMFVAEVGGRVVGFVGVSRVVHFTGAVEADVGELVVADDAEGMGVGRRLMTAAERWALAQGVGRVGLTTGAANVGARAFYASLGYQEEEVRLSRALPASVPMEEELE